MPDRITEITDHAQPAAVAPRRFGITILRAGQSKNGYTWPTKVLHDQAQLFEGVTTCTDHSRTRRSVRDINGTITGPFFDADTLSLKGNLNVIDPQIASVIEAWLQHRASANPVPDIGLSVDLDAEMEPGTKIVSQILAVHSVDVVFQPSAGGTFDRLLESQQESDTMEPTAEQLAAAAAASAQAAASPTTQQAAAAPTTPTAAQVLSNTAQTITEQTDQVAALTRARLAACSDLLTLRLSAAGLPEAARTRIAQQFTARIFEATELDTAIADMRALVGSLTGQATIHNGGISRLQMGQGPRERLQAACDYLLGNDVPDSVKGSFRRPFGLRDLFQGAGFDGAFGWESRRIMEADEVTTSIMAGIVGTSINKRLMRDFDAMPKWWKPIVVETDMRDMKVQTRIKLNDFAVLPTVLEDGDYVNLAWDDVSETMTPLKKGSNVHITLETIINDDLRAVQSVPKKLARAAVMTLNAYIVALFTAQSGTGPDLADTYAIFDASNHQSNLGSAALDAASLAAGMLAIAKMTDTASHRMGAVGKYLLIPPDLEATAWTLANSVLKPGTGDNDKNYLQGRIIPIVVPGFTDTNNWYIMPDPADIECIEVSYLNGQRTPELFVQDDPTSGAVFTNDAISYKIRSIFAAGWIDYRGTYGAVVT